MINGQIGKSDPRKSFRMMHSGRWSIKIRSQIQGNYLSQ